MSEQPQICNLEKCRPESCIDNDERPCGLVHWESAIRIAADRDGMSGMFDEARRQGRLLWVTAYAVTRSYGGPEEGGWWYNSHEPLESRSVSTEEESASTIVLLKVRWNREVAGGDIYSVRGGVAVEVNLEIRKDSLVETDRPRYE